MSGFDIAAVLVAIAAVSGYINNHVLRLPATSGTLVVALTSSLLVLAADQVLPGLHLQSTVATFVGAIDFNETLMRGMLAFLLFAGALHLDVEGLLENKLTIAALATIGVALSTAVVGVLSWWVFGLLGLDVPLLICLVFGALISPTDPIAVIGLLRELHAPHSLEAQIAGESLFNDGVGVVAFFAVVSLAGLSTRGDDPLAPTAAGIVRFFVQEVAGGVVLGLSLGFVTYRALKRTNEHSLELLMTLALAMLIYAVSFWIHVSGPIAVVVAGVLIGNRGRRLAMSARTREHVDAFWNMIDEILNAILFLLLGLEVIAIPADRAILAAAALAIPIVLAARLVSVAVPVTILRIRRQFTPGVIAVLTWCGLRGGISVALMLSLPPFAARDLLLACTYAVVVFSILVQGLTVRPLLVHYRVSE